MTELLRKLVNKLKCKFCRLLALYLRSCILNRWKESCHLFYFINIEKISVDLIGNAKMTFHSITGKQNKGLED